MNLTEILLRNDNILSRTQISGVVKTDVSPIKLAMVLEGPPLQLQMQRNLSRVSDYILNRAKRHPKQVGEFLGCLITIAEIYSDSIFPDSLFRKWDYSLTRTQNGSNATAVAPNDILKELLKIDVTIVQAYENSKQSHLPNLIEWEIGIGPIHPFYDSCGRISRYIATLLRYWSRLPLPLYTDRDTYMDAARQGPLVFGNYLEGLPTVIPPSQ